MPRPSKIWHLKALEEKSELKFNEEPSSLSQLKTHTPEWEIEGNIRQRTSSLSGILSHSSKNILTRSHWSFQILPTVNFPKEHPKDLLIKA